MKAQKCINLYTNLILSQCLKCITVVYYIIKNNNNKIVSIIMSKRKMNCLIAYLLHPACIHITNTIIDMLWTDISNKLTITSKLLTPTNKKLK